MTAVSVGTSSIELIDVDALIQNLGDDDLYVDDIEDVTSDSGYRIVAGDSIAVGGGHTYYGISGGSSDVRILPGGIGGTATLSSS